MSLILTSDLLPRVEETREQNIPKILFFDLCEIKQRFDMNIKNIEKQFVVADNLIQQEKMSEAKMIWRSQIAFLDSAFDFYMHELTQYGLMKIYKNEWPKTEKYNNIQVKMNIVEDALKNITDSSWFEQFVNSLYSETTLMSFDSIKQQLNLLDLSLKDISDIAYYKLGGTEKTSEHLKRRINELFKRRNEIVHQADRSLKNAKENPITEADVKDYIADIKAIVMAIQTVVLEKENHTK